MKKNHQKARAKALAASVVRAWRGHAGGLALPPRCIDP